MTNCLICTEKFATRPSPMPVLDSDTDTETEHSDSDTDIFDIAVRFNDIRRVCRNLRYFLRVAVRERDAAVRERDAAIDRLRDHLNTPLPPCESA